MKFRALTADDVEVRIATVKKSGVSLLLYKDARVDQNILDDTVGADNWQKKYEIIGGNLFCSVGIRTLHEDSQEREWIWKQDVGVESYTEKEKGQASDAFKRACFCWGIGRELYTAPFIWIPADKVEIDVQACTGQITGKLICNERFKVKRMQVENGKITALSIANGKGIEVYRMGAIAIQDVAQQATKTGTSRPTPILVEETEINIIKAELARTGVTESQICEAYHITNLKEMSVNQFYNRKARLKASKTKEEK